MSTEMPSRLLDYYFSYTKVVSVTNMEANVSPKRGDTTKKNAIHNSVQDWAAKTVKRYFFNPKSVTTNIRFLAEMKRHVAVLPSVKIAIRLENTVTCSVTYFWTWVTFFPRTNDMPGAASWTNFGSQEPRLYLSAKLTVATPLTLWQNAVSAFCYRHTELQFVGE
jgi:hypothetical protein